MSETAHRKQLQQEVIAAIVEEMDSAVAQGLDPIKTAMNAFTEVPESVIYEAFGHWQARDIDRWWAQVERSVDVEIIRRAIKGTTP